MVMQYSASGANSTDHSTCIANHHRALAIQTREAVYSPPSVAAAAVEPCSALRQCLHMSCTAGGRT